MSKANPKTAFEWPTIALAVFIYAAFGSITFYYSAIPFPLFAIACAVLVCWHSSLQHEILHGHPTKWRWLNRAIASVPLSLWLPYESYRVSHLVHHRDERLTDPLDDPESYYWTAESWSRLGAPGRVLVRAQTTLAGRMLIGPPWIIWRFWRCEMRDILAGNIRKGRVWRMHAVHVLAFAAWLVLVCKINLAVYVCCAVWPGTSLLLVRSFAEHRARDGVFERTAVVENAWILGPLYLFNNLHAAHHAVPDLPWYKLPGWYRAHRDELVAANGGLVYNGYADIARRYFFTPHDQPLHPLGRVSPGARPDGSEVPA